MDTIGPIQTPPLGLSSLLGLKGQGVPNALLNDVALMMDITQMYLIAIQEAKTFAGLAAAVGSNPFAADGVVPAGELWYVWDFQVLATSGVGVTGRFAPQMTHFSSLNIIKAEPLSIAASELLRVRAWKVPYWAQSGSVFGFMCQNVTGALTVSGSALISKLRA
jgi:hypothetical protein